MAKKPDDKDGGKKPVEKPVEKSIATPADVEPEIIEVKPVPRGRVEGKIDGLIEKVNKLTQEIFGLGETPVEETRPVQTAGKPDSPGPSPEEKDRGKGGGYPRLDFFP